jgi:hypothetical protein
MDKTQALKAALNGYKIRQPNWDANEFVYWNGDQFIYHNEHCDETLAQNSLEYRNGWERYELPVDFFSAWLAHESGQKIKSLVSGTIYQKGRIESHIFIEDINGKWAVLEGD